MTLSPDRNTVRERLEAHLRFLSETLGDRSVYRPGQLKAAEDYVREQFREMGYQAERQPFIYLRQEVANVIAGQRPHQGYYILGAHFDTVAGTPGADDNASGVAVLLETARLARDLGPDLPWAFVGFTTEEPPAFFTPYMGSRVYAKQARQAGDALVGMLCLEMVGYYLHEPESQELPFPLRFLGYPTTGNFIGLVANRRSRGLMRDLESALREGCSLPTTSLAVPFDGYILPETRLSDHASFWDQGFPAVMLTDTAFLRNPHYHGPGDTWERLDLAAMAELTCGLVQFIARTAGVPGG